MLNVGDIIKCHDEEDFLEYHAELSRGGYESEFVYERDGEEGLFLEITGLPEVETC